MKKVLWFVLFLVLVVGLVLTGCSNPSPTPTPAQTSAAPKTSAAPVPATSAAPAPATSAAPATTTAPSSSAAPASSAPAAGTPKKGGTLKIAESMFAANLGWPGDPGWLVQPSLACLFMDPLITVDINAVASPRLATAWKVSDDLKSITLTLRQGVKFHDGSTLNASVVKWNLDQLVNGKTGDFAQASSVDIVDDYTVKINLNSYTNSIIGTLGSAFIVSKAAYDAHGGGKDAETWMRNNPVGTGPFKMTSYTPNVSVKGVKFDGYWQPGKPYLDAVEMYLIIDPMTRAQALQNKEMDVDAGNISKVEADLKAQGYQVFQNYLSISCLVPDSATTTSPLANVKVRQAIDSAIDRDAIVKALGFGFTATDYQFAIPNTPTYITNLANFRPYNVDNAKKLLTEAGYPNGFKTKILGSTSTTNKDVMTAVQNYLSKIGITIDLSMIDHPTYTDAIRTKGWEGMAAASKLVDANMNLAIVTSWMPPVHPSMAKPDEFQALYKAAAATKDYDPKMTQKIVQYMYDNAMIINLYADPRLDVTQTYVKDPGFFTESRALNWQPWNVWLNK